MLHREQIGQPVCDVSFLLANQSAFPVIFRVCAACALTVVLEADSIPLRGVHAETLVQHVFLATAKSSSLERKHVGFQLSASKQADRYVCGVIAVVILSHCTSLEVCVRVSSDTFL